MEMSSLRISVHSGVQPTTWQLVVEAVGAADQDKGLELTNTDDDTLEPQTFTLEAWIKPKGNGFGGEPLVLDKPWKGAAGSWLGSYGIFWVPSGGALSGVIADKIGVSGLWLVSTGTAPIDEWTQVAFTLDGSWLRFHLNGEFDSEVAATSPTIDYGTQDVLFGAANFGSSFVRRFQGVIDRVRIWDHARSAETIRYRKDCPLGGDEDGLLAYYSFDSSDTPPTAPRTATTASPRAPWPMSAARRDASSRMTSRPEIWWPEAARSREARGPRPSPAFYQYQTNGTEALEAE